jgi:hypothetical protein
MSILVTFRGLKLWYLGDSLDDLDHALAPLHHADAQGNIVVLGESYAHVFKDGTISRYGFQIGCIADLKLAGTSNVEDGSREAPPEGKQ